MVVLILTFELDLKKHFLDLRHDTYVMTSEPDKNMSEIWLKFWTFKETGVERLPIMRFGTAVQHNCTLRGSSIFSGIHHGERGILSCLLYDLLHLSPEHGHPSLYWLTASQCILAFYTTFANLLSVEISL